MYENVNERISVIAIFGTTYKDVRPFKIRWHNRDVLITKVGYHHKYKEGNSTIHVFSATDGANFFELKYDSANLSWLLGRVADNEAS
jgi:hypothetical protein